MHSSMEGSCVHDSHRHAHSAQGEIQMKFKCGFCGTIVEDTIRYAKGSCTSKKQRTPNQIVCNKCQNFISFKSVVK